MSLERRRRRLEAKRRFKVVEGGNTGAPPPPQSANTRDRLGQAALVLVQQFRKQPEPLGPAEEVRVLLEVAAHLSLDQGADADQFGRVAAVVFEDYVSNVPPTRPNSAG